MTGDSPRPRAPRSDGLRNREALLSAAREVFTEDGPRAPLNAVARRAGVGQASLYRHFPTRTELVLALFEQSTELVEDAAQRLSGEPDAFARLLSLLIRGALDDIPLLGLVDHAEPAPALNAMAQRLERAFETPLAEAQRAGIVDRDLRTDDVVLIVRLLEGALQGVTAPARAATVARTLWLIGAGTRLPVVRVGQELSSGPTTGSQGRADS